MIGQHIVLGSRQLQDLISLKKMKYAICEFDRWNDQYSALISRHDAIHVLLGRTAKNTDELLKAHPAVCRELCRTLFHSPCFYGSTLIFGAAWRNQSFLSGGSCSSELGQNIKMGFWLLVTGIKQRVPGAGNMDRCRQTIKLSFDSGETEKQSRKLLENSAENPEECTTGVFDCPADYNACFGAKNLTPYESLWFFPRHIKVGLKKHCKSYD